MDDQQDLEESQYGAEEEILTGILIPAGLTVEPQTVTQGYSCIVTFVISNDVVVDETEENSSAVESDTAAAAAESVEFDQFDSDPTTTAAQSATGNATQTRDVDSHDPNHPRHHHGTASKADDGKTIRYRGLKIDPDTAPGMFFVTVTVNGASQKASAFYQPNTGVPPAS